MSISFPRLAAAAGIAVLLCGPAGALAADLPPPPPPPEIRSDWSGPYIGGAMAAACMETTYAVSTGADPELNGCSFAGGVLGGYNFQVSDNFVVGVEGDYMWGRQNAYNRLDQVHYAIDGVATVRGRVGYLDYDTLFYATAGVGWLNGSMDALVGPKSLSGHDKGTHTGFVVGGGIEHAFTPELHARIEYLYGAFNNQDYDLSVSTCSPTCIVDLDFRHLHMVRAAVTWNFGSMLW
jgi:opacity protein-like surface antigen